MGWNEYLFFLGPSKLLFFDSFQSADLHFVWFVVAILEMFLRGKSRAPPNYPTRVRTHQTHINAATGMRAHHPAHDHSPHELSVFIFGGPRVFWFVALALHSTSSTVCFLSTCPWSMEKILFLFLLDYIFFFNPILVVSRTQSLEKKKRSVRGGGWVLDILFKLLEQPNRIVFISFELVSYAWNVHKILHRLADEMLVTVKCQWFPNSIV